ncbi:hypothetical protein [Solirubrobacter soli]|uniref:hypothetical protein n=1 Tax=Solirubrobacter soli TaxID=363832 RepID=UPI0004195C5E|nr:hypothetical protein [Solirubrobacter soli]
MTEHERELDDLEERSEQLGEEIADVREDWERKKADDQVPGAQGEPRDEDERKPWPDE